MSTETDSASHGTGFAYLLTLTGALPFVAAAAVIIAGPVEHQALALQAMTTYAAVILSFLGGVQWGIGVSINANAPRSAQTLFVLAIVPALLAWALLFVAQPNARVLVAIFLFGFVWVVDALLCLQKLIPPWFFRLRCIVSAIVIASLLMAALHL